MNSHGSRSQSRSRSRDRQRRGKDHERPRSRDRDTRPSGRRRSRSPVARVKRRSWSRDRSISRSPPPKRQRRTPSRSRSPIRKSGREKRRSRSPYQRWSSRDRARSPRRDKNRRRSTSRASNSRRDRSRDRRRERSPRSHGRGHARSRSRSRDVQVRSRAPLPDQEASFRGAQGEEPPVEKQKPNFNTTGILAKEANTLQFGKQKIELKYHEPPEARKPASSHPWRMYIFKGQDVLDTVLLHTRSCWLVGRERAIADLFVDSPGVSGQHAVVQFRYVKGKVRPYLIDLESANGTLLNDEAAPPGRYLELRDKDMVKFGNSEREYVFMLPSKEDVT